MKAQYVKNTVPVTNDYPVIACDHVIGEINVTPAGHVFKVECVTQLDVILTSKDVDIMVNPQIFMKFFKYVDGE